MLMSLKHDVGKIELRRFEVNLTQTFDFAKVENTF